MNEQLQIDIVECEICGQEDSRSNMFLVPTMKNKILICGGCYDGWVWRDENDRCGFCEEKFPEDDLTDFDGEKACAGCLEELK